MIAKNCHLLQLSIRRFNVNYIPTQYFHDAYITENVLYNSEI